MREIKFRGKATMSNHELDYQGIPNFKGWVWGSLIVDGSNFYIVGDIVEASDDGLIHEWWARVYSDSVGQNTDLKDENGREIYEGDVLRHKIITKRQTVFHHHEIIGEVLGERGMTYIEGICNHGYLEEGIETKKYKALLLSEEVFEVIGNIYDNPELLKDDTND